MAETFDLCIVGSGPAGIFASLEMGKSYKVLILELGRPFSMRQFCKVSDMALSCDGCGNCCNIITGFGGAFCFQNGGLLSLYPAGSSLLSYYDSESLLLQDYSKAIQSWKLFSMGQISFVGSTNQEEISNYSEKVKKIGAAYKHFNGYRLSRKSLRKAVMELERYVSRIADIRFNSRVTSIAKEGNLWQLQCSDGKKYSSKAVLFATGRKGNSFTSKQLEKIGVAYKKTGIDLGVRIELPHKKIDEISKLHPDVKIKFNIDGEEVRTFCFCPEGRITHFSQDALVGKKKLSFLEGYIDEDSPSERTNLSFLHRINFQSTDEVWEFQKKFEEAYHSLGGKIIAQRLKDVGQKFFAPLPKKATLKDYRIGDVSKIIPERTFTILMEAIKRFDKLTGSALFDNDETIVCAPELGNFWPEIKTDNYFQTNKKGLFIAGDSLGFIRGALQASVTGIRAAEGIKKYLDNYEEGKSLV